MKLLQESSDGEGTLRIGGVVLRVDDDGNVLSKQRKGAGRPRQVSTAAAACLGWPAGAALCTCLSSHSQLLSCCLAIVNMLWVAPIAGGAARPPASQRRAGWTAL